MHRQVEWMKAADMSILRVLDNGLALRTGDIAYNADLSRGYTSNRLRVLVEHGLVNTEATDKKHPRYRISQLGKDVLYNRVEPEDVNDTSVE